MRWHKIIWIIISLILFAGSGIEVVLLFGGGKIRLGHIEYLWWGLGFLLVFVMAFYILRWRKKKIEQIIFPPLKEKIIKGKDLELEISRFVMFSGGLGMCLLALARPQGGGETKLLSKRGIDIVLAIDFSKSMLAKDALPSRIERAKIEVRELLKETKGDRVGVVAFAGDTITFPLTTDTEAVYMFLKDLHPYDMPVGGTAIGKAIVAAIRLLQNASFSKDRTKVILLLTDGEDHESDPVEAAKEAQKLGIKIYTIGIGSFVPELIPRYLEDGSFVGYQQDENGNYITTRLTPENEKILKEIAQMTGGLYIHASKGDTGIHQFRTALNRLKKHQLKVKSVVVYEELFNWFLLPGFLMLLVYSLMPRGKVEG